MRRAERVSDESVLERMVRFLDGASGAREAAEVSRLIRDDPRARDLLQDLAETAVLVADGAREGAGPVHRPGPPARRRSWGRWSSIAAGIAVVGAAVGALSARTVQPVAVGRVERAVGPTRLFTAAGRILEGVPPGESLGPGDTLESRSSDSWVGADLGDGAEVTIAGESVVRVLRPDGSERWFDLVEGSLWFSPGAGASPAPVVVRTAAAVLEGRGALFDVRASATESIVRVHGGTVRVVRRVDGAVLDVRASERATVSLAAADALVAEPQPASTSRWRLDPATIGDAGLGLYRPATATAPARLAAFPLLWREGDLPPVLIHVVGAAVRRASDAPVRIGPATRIRFRCRSSRPATICFGVSTQRLGGVFAGKFDVRVPPEAQRPSGDAWEVEVGIGDLRPVSSDLADSAHGLELAEVYAVSIVEDVGLELETIDVAGE